MNSWFDLPENDKGKGGKRHMTDNAMRIMTNERWTTNVGEGQFLRIFPHLVNETKND